MLKIVSLTLFAGFFAVVITDYVFETALYQAAQPVFGVLVALNVWFVRNAARYLQGVSDGSIDLQRETKEKERKAEAASFTRFYD